MRMRGRPAGFRFDDDGADGYFRLLGAIITNARQDAAGRVCGERTAARRAAAQTAAREFLRDIGIAP